jgi:hypothetical protein
LDDRSLDWLHLLPADCRFVAHEVPADFRALLGRRITADGDSYLGWNVDRRSLPDLTRYEAVVLVNPRGVGPSELSSVGFKETRRFQALPSLREARWLIPASPARVAARSLDVYAAHRRSARLRKRLVGIVARMGQAHRLGDGMVLGRRTKSAFEIEAERINRDQDVALSLSTGTPQAHRKPTIQVMTTNGRIVAYAKIAASEPARTALQREIAWLQDLAHRPALIDAVPRLLGMFQDSDSLVAFQKPGPPGRGPAVFGSPHQVFLQSLARATRRHMPFEASAMWRGLNAAYEALEPRLSTAWRASLRSAIVRLRVAIGASETAVTTAHRDFRPRNHRLHCDGRLFVFDWELAQSECTPLYDLFDFHVEGYAYFERRANPDELVQVVFRACRRWEPDQDSGLIRYWFLAYLVDRALTRLRNGFEEWESMADRLLPLVSAVLDRHGAWLPSAPTPGQ